MATYEIQVGEDRWRVDVPDEVEADDDWTRTVPRIPMQSAAIGLEAAENNRSCVSSPMILMPVSSDETPTRKT